MLLEMNPVDNNAICHFITYLSSDDIIQQTLPLKSSVPAHAKKEDWKGPFLLQHSYSGHTTKTKLLYLSLYTYIYGLDAIRYRLLPRFPRWQICGRNIIRQWRAQLLCIGATCYTKKRVCA